MSGITPLVNHIRLPRFAKVRQEFPHCHEQLTQEQIAGILDAGFAREDLKKRVRPGMRVCITCGSRGISNYPFVIKQIVEHVKALGGQPFMVPAMGSHGGATAEGQRQVLAALGITEETMGCPLLSSMETVPISHVDDFDVRIDKNAYEADAIIAVNRVKAHTSFRGPYESGVMKILTIGLGKQYGAHTCHARGDDEMSHRIGLIGTEVIHKANVIMGVALVENAFDKTLDVAVMPGEEIPQREPALLTRAKEAMGHLHLPECDILVVQQIGKEFSGSGADPNVVGRGNPKLNVGIKAQRLVVCDLSDASHGNATGMGKFELGTRRFFNKIDMDQTYPNCITDYSPGGAKIPMIADNDREAMQAAVVTCLNIDYENPRMIIIKNSLEIGTILVSESLLPQARQTEGMAVEGEPFALPFDGQGGLLPCY